MTTTAVRGSQIIGASIGVAIMDRQLPRTIGDTGDPRTFDFPVHYDVVRTPARLWAVSATEADAMYPLFLESFQRLAAAGVHAVTTTSGYAALFQSRFVEDLDIPVAASSLLQIPTILATLPAGSRLGVLAAKGSSLSTGHLGGVGLTEAQIARLDVIGLDEIPHWDEVMLNDFRSGLDVSLMAREISSLCADFVGSSPSLRGLVAECSSLHPYSAAIQRATGLPFWDNITLITWLQRAVRAVGQPH